MLRDGVYLVLACKHADNPTDPYRALAGRFSVEGHEIEHLEDHFGHLKEAVPEGPLTHAHVRALANLMASGYYELLHEDDLEGGKHPELVPEFPLHYGAVPTYQIKGGDLSGQQVKIYGSTVFTQDGGEMSEMQARQLLSAAEAGEIKLVPVEQEQGAME